MLLGTAHDDKLWARFGAYQGLRLFEDVSTDWRESRFQYLRHCQVREVKFG